MDNELNGESKNLFDRNLREISEKLKYGLTKEELETSANLPISPDWKVKDLIEANLKTGYIRYNEGKFTTLVTSVEVKLTNDEEDILNQKAVEFGLSPQELVKEYIIKGLSSN